MVTHIADLDRGIIDLYAGDYDHFEEEKQQRYEALVNAAKNQQREIDSAEAFIRRFRAKNTKAKQVQQKIRQLEKTERIDAPSLERKTIKFRFPQPPRTGRVVAEVKHVRKAYGDNAGLQATRPGASSGARRSPWWDPTGPASPRCSSCWPG